MRWISDDFFRIVERQVTGCCETNWFYLIWSRGDLIWHWNELPIFCKCMMVATICLMWNLKSVSIMEQMDVVLNWSKFAFIFNRIFVFSFYLVWSRSDLIWHWSELPVASKRWLMATKLSSCCGTSKCIAIIEWMHVVFHGSKFPSIFDLNF